jgi:hypothetical protein
VISADNCLISKGYVSASDLAQVVLDRLTDTRIRGKKIAPEKGNIGVLSSMGIAEERQWKKQGLFSDRR